MLLYKILKSPIGNLTLSTDGECLIGLTMESHRHGPSIGLKWQRSTLDPILLTAETQLQEYFSGNRTVFDIRLKSCGTDFQHRCWQVLRTIPFSKTWSYGAMATRVGNSKASRAVGAANGKNPISIIVPCHRVIGSSGKLVGFGGGLHRKAALLNFERAIKFGESADEFWAANPWVEG